MPPSPPAPVDGRPTLLVLRALHLGDLLVSVPALRALRRARPEHRSVLAAPGVLAPLAALTGAVDELLPTADPGSLRWDRPAPDVAVNLHGAGPQSHRALDDLAPHDRMGFTAPGWPGPAWDAVAEHDHERERWCTMLAAHGVPTDAEDLLLDAPAPAAADTAAADTVADAPVIVHPGARYGSKRWPPARFTAVAAALDDAGYRVLLTGSADERPLAEEVARGAGLPETRVLAGGTCLQELCELVAGAALVVSGDTGIAHLASAFRTPSVVLFGPVSPQRWGPPATGPHVALTAADQRLGDPFADRPDPALLGVSVPDVLAAAHTLLTGAGTRVSPAG